MPPRARCVGASRGTAAAPDRLRGARTGGTPERRQRLHRHHPRRDRGGEVLGEERAQRLVLPRLDVARRPVVDAGRDRTDDRSMASIGDRVAQRVAGADEDARPPARSRAAGSDRTPARPRRPACVWPQRPPHRRAADDERRGAAVIADRARACSSAAAGCRAASCGRRWSRGAPTRRSRCSRRPRPARTCRPRPAAPGMGRPRLRGRSASGASRIEQVEQGVAQRRPGGPAPGHQRVQAPVAHAAAALAPRP